MAHRVQCRTCKQYFDTDTIPKEEWMLSSHGHYHHTKCYKGIYFALKYFYEVKKNAWDKGHGGIGIVGYVYQDSVEYWTEQERKQRGFMEALEKQLEGRQTREVVKIKRPQTKKAKTKYSLDDVGGE